MTESKSSSAAESAIREAVASSKCTTRTVIDLRALLGVVDAPDLQQSSQQNAKSGPATASVKRNDNVRGPAVAQTGARQRSKTLLKTKGLNPVDAVKTPTELEVQAKLRLATEIVNISLQALTVLVKEQADKGATIHKRALQPLSPNQKSKSPRADKENESKNKLSVHDFALAECATAAFTSLRRANSNGDGPNAEQAMLRVVQGMYSLATKLVALGMDDSAQRVLSLAIQDLQPVTRAPKLAEGKRTLNAPGLVGDLAIRTIPQSVSGNELLVLCQVQVLKLVSRIPSQSSKLAALDTLLNDSHTSVVTIIDQSSNNLSGESAKKYARACEQISQALRTLIDGLISPQSKNVKDPRRLPCASTTCGRLLELRMKCLSWTLTSPVSDSTRHIVRPLLSCMSQLAREHETLDQSGYEQLVTHSEKFIQFAKDIPNEILDQSQAHTIEIAIYRTLAQLAKELKFHEASMSWLTRCLEKNGGNISSCLLTAIQCQLASSSLQSRQKINQNELRCRLESACNSLNERLQGSTSDIDDLLVALSSLRKQGMTFLLEMQKEEKQGTVSGPEVRNPCKKFVLELPRILRRLLVHLDEQGAASNKDQNTQQRKALFAQVARPAIDAAALLSRPSFATKDDIEFDATTTFHECAQLAIALEDAQLLGSGTGNEARTSIFVNISNALWFQYQQNRRNGQMPERLRSCLSQAIKILESRSTEEKIAGFLAQKHEKLGGLLESVDDFAGAVVHYKRAMANHPDIASVQGVVGSHGIVTSSPVELASACLKAQSCLCSSRRTLLSPIMFDDYDQTTQLHCLEAQMETSIDSLHAGESLVDGDFLLKLYRAITEIYENLNGPKSRAYLELRILNAACTFKEIIPKTMIEEILKKPLEVQEDDSEDHLRSQRDLYDLMLKDEGDYSAITRILTQWHKLTQKKDQFQSFLRKIHVGAWISQLKLLEILLRFRGNTDVHIDSLEILCAICSSETALDIDSLVTFSTALSDELLKIGRPACSGRCLLKVQHYVKKDEASNSSVLWHLSYADYHLAIGNHDKCEAVLSQVRDKLQDVFSGTASFSWKPTRYDVSLITSKWLYQQSKLARRMERHGVALYCARKSSKFAYKAWSLFERQKSSLEKAALSSQAHNEPSKSELCVSTRHDSLSMVAYQQLVPPLFEHNAHLARALLDSGLVLEAQYYADQASRVAVSSRSGRYQSSIAILKAETNIYRNEAAAALEALETVSPKVEKLTPLEQAEYHLALAKAHHALTDYDSEAQALKKTELLLNSITLSTAKKTASSTTDIDKLQDEFKAMAVTPRTSRAVTTTRQPGKMQKPRTRPEESSSTPTEHLNDSSLEHHLIHRLQAERLRQSCMLALTLGDAVLGSSLLSGTSALLYRKDIFANALCEAALHLNQASTILARDPIFGVLQESAIMLPSKMIRTPLEIVTESTENQAEASSKSKQTRSRKAAAPKPDDSQDGRITQTSSYPLAMCGNALLQLGKAKQVGTSTIMNHTYSDLLTKTQLLLSATTGLDANTTYSPWLSSWAFELGRSLAFVREKASVEAERLLEIGREQADDAVLKIPDIALPRLDSISFQKDFVDIIPATWNVVTIALSENKSDLRISRIRACKAPVTLTIPLDRHNPRDCDEEAFGIAEGKAELREIISLANFSAHDAGDLSKKGAKTAWWEARAALDARLKDLMVNIENMWLGGFRGLFSQHATDPHLLSRFQQSIETILNKYLPSRQKVSKTNKLGQTTLDPQVLELFVCLGDPRSHPDMDETLIDLFYFVVDILQFNGERNAYDEIDFDPMIIETMDALTHYHDAFQQKQTSETTQHTVLILDKALHLFPWESMPFVDGNAISRLPSLAALRERILMLKEQSNTPNDEHTLQVDMENGAYILNPSSDLAATHKTFQKPLSALTSWDATINSPPSESEISTFLKNKSIYLYLGHGSGGQYIRSRTIRRLPKCAVSLLMGCSSATMTEAGRLESYGVPLTYLQAGAPAVVGTLWDVTDKDIDRYSSTVLERWGLLNRKTIPEEKKDRRGKMKVKGDEPANDRGADPPVSLDKAVAEARSSCILRYLNGAASVVYGIPVSLA